MNAQQLSKWELTSPQIAKPTGTSRWASDPDCTQPALHSGTHLFAQIAAVVGWRGNTEGSTIAITHWRNRMGDN